MSDTRIKSFKFKGRDVAEMRRRRAETTVELRRNRKDEQMLKRRNVPLNFDIDTSPKSLDQLVVSAKSSNIEEQLVAVSIARKILSRDKNPPIDELVRCGIVPILVACLQSENSSLQFEAAWALTNIASGNSHQTRTVVQYGAVPFFIQLLSSPHTFVCEQAVWALGNITGDGPECRDYVIEQGIISPLLSFVNRTTPVSFLRNVAWTLSNLCRNKDPPPPFESVCQCLPALVQLVEHEDIEVKVDACWALSFLADGKTKQIQVVVDSNVIPRLIPLLFETEKIALPALRTLGNIVTGTDQQTQRVLDGGILPALQKLVCHNKTAIVRETVWTLSNILAGNRPQIQMVIDAGLVPPLVRALSWAEFRIQREAAWAVSNFTVGGTIEQVSYLVNCGVVPAMCLLLDCKEPTIVQVILDGLANILKQAGEEVGCVATAIEEAGGLDKLEKLQEHPNENIYKLALAIIDGYFNTEDIEDASSAAIAPAVGLDSYQFGPGSLPDDGFQF